MTQFKKNAFAQINHSDLNLKQSGAKKRIHDRTERFLLGLPLLEDDLQMDVMDECQYIKYKNRPVSMYLHHSPNGGYRGKREAARFKKMGTKKGFPDLFLFIAIGEYKGLFIEMKSKTGSEKPDQAAMRKLLTEEGYKVVMCKTVQSAVNEIKSYLNIKTN